MTTSDDDRPLRVVLIGPESTGKTRLANDLATRYDVPWSPEFAREYVEGRAGPVLYSDVETIGRGQKAGEERALARAIRLGMPLVVLDTDLVSTAVYSRHYYGDCPEWIEREAGERLADLYLLHHVDVDWVADGSQREQPERREELFERFRATLEELDARVDQVRGTWQERTRHAIQSVDRLLGGWQESGYTGAHRSGGGRKVDDTLRDERVREITEFLEQQWPRASAEGSSTITDRWLRLASAVLMVGVVRVDRASRQDEHRALESALSRALDLEVEEAGLVVRAAEDAIARGASFSRILQHLDAGCTPAQKRQLVEALWRIAFSDAELAGQEEYLVRKIAGKLNLTTADLMETKVRAREEFLKEEL